MKSNTYIWLINGTEGFGISRATITLAKELKKNKKKVTFVSISKGILVDSLIKNDFEVRVLDIEPSLSFKKSILYFFSNLVKNFSKIYYTQKKIKEVVHGNNYDVLIYRSPGLTLFASLLKTKGNIKVFIMPNIIGNSYFLNINKYLYLLAIKFGKINVLGNSQFTANTIAGLGVKPKVLHLGIDTADFQPNKQVLNRSNFKLAKTDLVFGVFARFDVTKAQDIVIKAFSELVNKFPNLNLKLLLVGYNKKNAFYDECVELIIKYNLSNNIILVEQQNNIIPYYSLVDIMINSRRDAEPFGLTVIESMLMQKPIIAYKLGGPSETIIDNKTGWLINEPNVEGYSKIFEKAILKKNEWTSIGETGRIHAISNFSIEVFYQNFNKIINELQ